MINSVRSAIAKRARYSRTVREIQALDPQLAIEDLGIVTSDAQVLARQAVYGR
ncbi:hypothetical protein [Roseisalinus antarcticus]|uniref:DUF1127 domain-containing protein n=1 Tax=Roseisalinus antarcticus TaxID=254357 RepID=A0A1Y5RG84_9RHOB|nr:hypothetical protein [Roseisalinus antarcticus]SLN16549.1 hypothetical protein ROA7023_00302 [Roseisalinus antarcticus]